MGHTAMPRKTGEGKIMVRTCSNAVRARTTVLLAVVALMATLTGGLGTADARPADSPADRMLELAEMSGPTGPAESSDVSIRGNAATILSEFGRLRVSAPGQGPGRDVGGMVVTDSSMPGLLLGARPVAQGIQMLSTFTGPDAPTSVTYDLDLPDGVVMREAADGSLELVTDLSEGVELVLGTVRSPWAVDANGTSRDTHFEVDGGQLVQHVDHEGAAYPVVADPWITFGRRIYINYNHFEVHQLVNEYGEQYAGSSIAAGLLCGFGGPYAALCSVAVGYASWSIWQTLVDAHHQHECFQLGIPYGGGFPTWNVLNC